MYMIENVFFLIELYYFQVRVASLNSDPKEGSQDVLTGVDLSPVTFQPTVFHEAECTHFEEGYVEGVIGSVDVSEIMPFLTAIETVHVFLNKCQDTVWYPVLLLPVEVDDADCVTEFAQCVQTTEDLLSFHAVR